MVIKIKAFIMIQTQEDRLTLKLSYAASHNYFSPFIILENKYNYQQYYSVLTPDR